MVAKKGAERKHDSAAELLGDWRAAERDTAAARTAVSVASLAVAAASAAEAAAAEAESAASAAMDAATRAKSAAEHAKRAAAMQLKPPRWPRPRPRVIGRGRTKLSRQPRVRSKRRGIASMGPRQRAFPKTELNGGSLSGLPWPPPRNPRSPRPCAPQTQPGLPASPASAP